jgi:hypothetical protein
MIPENIKRLAEQAGGTQKYVPHPGVWQFFDDELEKFVELILAEKTKLLQTNTTGEQNGKSTSSN